jgi:hypothetical protein
LIKAETPKAAHGTGWDRYEGYEAQIVGLVPQIDRGDRWVIGRSLLGVGGRIAPGISAKYKLVYTEGSEREFGTKAIPLTEFVVDIGVAF